MEPVRGYDPPIQPWKGCVLPITLHRRIARPVSWTLSRCTLRAVKRRLNMTHMSRLVRVARLKLAASRSQTARSFHWATPGYMTPTSHPIECERWRLNGLFIVAVTTWCARWDSNPQSKWHGDLSTKCMPIPPLAHMVVLRRVGLRTARLWAKCSTNWTTEPYLLFNKIRYFLARSLMNCFMSP